MALFGKNKESDSNKSLTEIYIEKSIENNSIEYTKNKIKNILLGTGTVGGIGYILYQYFINQ